MDESEDETQNPFSEENWMKQNNWKFIKYENEDEAENPLSEENWVKQTNRKFTKYVIHHRHFMTPEQLKQKPIENFLRNNMKNLMQRKGSQMNRKRNPLHPQKSQNKNLSQTDEQESNTTETLQLNNVSNTITHDEENSSEAEDDTSEDENVTEMQT